MPISTDFVSSSIQESEMNGPYVLISICEYGVIIEIVLYAPPPK